MTKKLLALDKVLKYFYIWEQWLQVNTFCFFYFPAYQQQPPPLVYLISADTVMISDNAKTLGGDIYGNSLEIGADSEIYGNVAANAKCFLRERASISGVLSFPASCPKQNGISIGKEVSERTEYAHSAIENFSAGSQNKSIAIGTDEQLLPGAYGNLRIDARSAVRLRSGSYVFSNIHTEPDVKWFFDLTEGPVKIYVLYG